MAMRVSVSIVVSYRYEFVTISYVQNEFHAASLVFLYFGSQNTPGVFI